MSSCPDSRYNSARFLTLYIGPLAQLVEHRTFNPMVGRSNRPRPTIFPFTPFFPVSAYNVVMQPTVILTIFLSLFPSLVWAMPGDGKYTDPIAPVILGVTGILFFALIGRFLARKLG